MVKLIQAIEHAEDMLATPDNVRVADIIIQNGEGKLQAGTILGKVTATGKYRAWDTRNSDGSETISAVLGCDVDATSADTKAFAYVEGTFVKEKLIAKYGTVPTGALLYGNIVIKSED